MTHFIAVGRGGIVDRERIVIMAPIRSAPVKRWLEEFEPDRILNLTFGYPKQTLLLLEDGLILISSLTMDQLVERLVSERIDPYEPTFK